MSHLDYIMVNPHSQFARELVAWWPVGNRRSWGSPALQDAGFRHNAGSLLAASSAWVADARASIEFDGIDDYIDCGDKDIFEFAGDFAVSCWFRSTSTGDQALVTKWTGSGSGSQWLVVQYQNTLRGNIYVTDGNVVLDSGVNYFDGKWHHAVLVRRGSTGYFYVDGVEKASNTVGVNPAGQNTAPLTLGNYNGQGTWPYRGRLDDVRVHNRALSSAEVARLHAETRCGYGSLAMPRRRRWFPAIAAGPPIGPFSFRHGLVEPVAVAAGESESIQFSGGLAEPVTVAAGESEV